MPGRVSRDRLSDRHSPRERCVPIETRSQYGWRMLRVRVLGELVVESGGRPIELTGSWRARSLLAWLALNPGNHPRGELAARFWPEVLDSSARASLRNSLWALRKALDAEDADALVATRERVGLKGEPDVWVDVVDFERDLAAGRLDEALALTRGELLAGLEDDWVYEYRDAHRLRLSELLEGDGGAGRVHRPQPRDLAHAQARGDRPSRRGRPARADRAPGASRGPRRRPGGLLAPARAPAQGARDLRFAGDPRRGRAHPGGCRAGRARGAGRASPARSPAPSPSSTGGAASGCRACPSPCRIGCAGGRRPNWSGARRSWTCSGACGRRSGRARAPAGAGGGGGGHRQEPPDAGARARSPRAGRDRAARLGQRGPAHAPSALRRGAPPPPRRSGAERAAEEGRAPRRRPGADRTGPRRPGRGARRRTAGPRRAGATGCSKRSPRCWRSWPRTLRSCWCSTTCTGPTSRRPPCCSTGWSRAPTCGCSCVATQRPGEGAAVEAHTEALQRLSQGQFVERVPLSGLADADIAELSASLSGRELSPELVRAIQAGDAAATRSSCRRSCAT